MKKKLFALLLCLAMLTALFAGCGQNASTPEPASSTAESSASTPSEAPAAEVPVSAEEPPSTTEPAVENTISYPVANGETYTISVVMDSNLLDSVPGGDPANANGVKKMCEVTGINLDYTVFPMMSDNMTLMISSGDWTDIFCKIDENYANGLDGALEEDVIIDLEPYLAEYAPSYYNYVNTTENAWKDSTTDDGKVGAFYIFNQPGLSGFAIRQDWLKDANIDKVPETFDELETACLAVMDAHPELNRAIPSGSSFIAQGYESELMYGYGLNTINYEFYRQEDGKIGYAWTSDAARDYLEMTARWVSEGIYSKDEMLSADIATMGNDLYLGSALLKHNDAGMWGSEYLSMVEDPNFDLVPMNYPTITGKEPIRYVAGAASTSPYWSISSTCENVEPLISAIDWIFTEEGTIAMNFGEEGVSYTVDDAGNYHFTDLVLNNPDGVPQFMAAALYTGFEVPKVVMQEANDAKWVNQEQLDAQDFWRTQERMNDGARQGKLTVAENEALAGYTDIQTYLQEKLMAFALGDLEMNDANWNDFVSTIEDMGIQDYIDIYQAAQDRYDSK